MLQPTATSPSWWSVVWWRRTSWEEWLGRAFRHTSRRVLRTIWVRLIVITSLSFSVLDPDSGVSWIRIWNPNPDPGAYKKVKNIKYSQQFYFQWLLQHSTFQLTYFYEKVLSLVVIFSPKVLRNSLDTDSRSFLIFFAGFGSIFNEYGSKTLLSFRISDLDGSIVCLLIRMRTLKIMNWIRPCFVFSKKVLIPLKV